MSHGLDDHWSMLGANLCSLTKLDEESIILTLEQRYFTSKIYTFANRICIAVNPYRTVHPRIPDASSARYTNDLCVPMVAHVLAISEAAWRGASEGNRDQCIIVNGESGAGKTESVKILLEHIAELASFDDNQAAACVMSGSAVLERFGNAATARNDNSSRFGAYLTLHFSNDCVLERTDCHTYLLEKCRVAGSLHGCGRHGDRNFHIFYEVLCSPEDWRQQVGLGNLGSADFHYTHRAPLSEALVDHYSAQFQHTRAALQQLLRAEGGDADRVLSVVAAILHLGQVRPLGSGALDESTHFPHFCRLLGLPESQMEEHLCHKHMVVAASCILMPLSAEQTAAQRDAVAKELYARLFHWLVKAVYRNPVVSEGEGNGRGDRCGSISLLDIFGFETFDDGAGGISGSANSLEQLCINYANEVLQLRFARDSILCVQEEYAAEQVQWEPVGFTDNQAVLDLLEGKLGVFALLNEECNVPGGSAANFCAKLLSRRGSSEALSSDLLRPGTFRVRHYAGIVTYDTLAFVEKNRDAFPADTARILAAAENPEVSALFQEDRGTSCTTTAPDPGGQQHPLRRPSASATTICSKFRLQLRSLAAQLDRTSVQYIRCIKPNATKSCAKFDRQLVAEQLRAGGLVEAARVQRSAYPHKQSHEECLRACTALLQTSCATIEPSRDTRTFLRDFLVARLHLHVSVGVSTVYFAPGAFEELHLQIDQALRSFATRLQSWALGRLHRIKFVRWKTGARCIQAAYRRHVSLRARRRQEAATRVQSWARMRLSKVSFAAARTAVQRVQAWARCVLCVLAAKRRLRAVLLLQRWARELLRRQKARLAAEAITQTVVLGKNCQRICPRREVAHNSTQTDHLFPAQEGHKVNGRVRWDPRTCQALLDALWVEWLDCFPTSPDPRTWTPEGREELVALLLGAAAVALTYYLS